MYIEVGESAEIRTAAYRLRNTAATIGVIGARYGQVIDALQFEGHAANLLRLETSQQLSVVSRVVAELAEEHQYLLRQAAAYEAGGVG